MGGGIIIFGIMAVAIVVIALVRANSANEAWAQVGTKLGLHYQAGGAFGQRRLSGKLFGFRVSVRTERVRRGKSRKTFTCYVVHYPALGLGLELARESVLTAVGKFFGKQDLEIGDREFDREVRITAKSRSRLIEFLTPRRKAVILRTLGRYASCVITDAQVECRERGLALNARDMKLALHNLLELVQALTGPESEEVEEVVLTPTLVPVDLGQGTSDPEPVVYEELFPLAPVVMPPETIEMSEGVPEPAPEPRVEPIEVSEGMPEPPVEPDEEREPSLPIAALLEELFAENQTANVTAELFEARYHAALIRGTGRLQRVERYFSDRFFGSVPGARATLVVREPSSEAFGVRAVQAVIQLDAEEEELLQERVGETVAFVGRLVHCDPYLRNLVVAEAELR